MNVEALISQLTANSQTIAVAESLTGGLLADALVTVPGASKVFLGGIVSYSDSSKVNVLGLPANLLNDQGAVSAQTALAMAKLVATRFEATFGLSTTGVAGPDPVGQSPVGEVFVAISGPGVEFAQELQVIGSRAEIRSQAVLAALELLWKHSGK